MLLLTDHPHATPKRPGSLSPFEYLIPLISVLVGLAIANLATSLHKLLQARQRVEWDWLPLMAALLALLSVLDMWWFLYGVREQASISFASFLPLAATLIVLFLVCAAILPDDVPSDGLDLRAFYRSNGSYFWSLFAVYITLVTMYKVVQFAVTGFFNDANATDLLIAFASNLLLLGIFLALAFIRNRWFHAVAVMALLALLISSWAQRSLGVS